MHEVKYDSNSLMTSIELLERRIHQLAEEEFEQNEMQRQLGYRLKELEGQRNQRSNIRDELEEQHQHNMQYLDSKIDNHQQTLEKYKALYESLNNGGQPNFNSNTSSKRENVNRSNIYMGKEGKEGKASDLCESVKSSRSGLNSLADMKGQIMSESLNVICEM